MPWDGQERRKENMNVETEIRLIQQDIQYVRGTIEEANRRNGHFETIFEEYRKTVIELSSILKSLTDDFKNHTTQDSWFFGLIVTTQIGIILALVKMIIK